MANLGPNFYPKLVQISSELGMNPEDLIAVMIGESGLDPSALEKVHKGSGLVGFMPDTLKGLGFKGTWKDFIKLSGEEQLDYVKKLVSNFAKLNGGPFKSAAQYYTANFWPVALKLPGIQQENPNTPIVEANPQGVKLPDGQLYSKKYYEVGQKIPVKMEAGAYKANPILDLDKDGIISYGDMMKRVDAKKKSGLYRQALADMKNTTGYAPKDDKQSPIQVVQNNSVINELDGMMNSVLNSLAVKQLPPNYFLIKVDSINKINNMEFGRILSLAINELAGESNIHFNKNSIELSVNIPGKKSLATDTLIQLTQNISESFESATNKIGSLIIKCNIVPNEQSSYAELDVKTAEKYYDLFHAQFKRTP